MPAVFANWVSELRLKFTGGKCRLGKNRSTEAFIFQAMKKTPQTFQKDCGVFDIFCAETGESIVPESVAK